MIEQRVSDYGRTLDQRLWDDHWHLLCHRSEVAQSNSFVRFEMLDQEVVVLNDGADVLAFDNRCPHRGTRIYDGTAGRQRFVCPYHGWSWAKGRMFVPGKEMFTDCDPTQARLNTLQTQWLGDFLFVSPRPIAKLHDQLGETAILLEQIGLSISNMRDLTRYRFGCNWKIATENALDQYHVSLVHRDTLNRLQMAPAVDSYHGNNNISRAALGDARLARRLSSMKRFFDLSYQDPGYTALYIFPFTFITTTFGYFYSVQQYLPMVDPDRSSFTTRFYQARLSDKIRPETLDSYFASSLALGLEVFTEDNEVCSRMPIDTWSPTLPAFLSSGEEKIAHFRANLRNYVATSAQPLMASSGQAASQ